MMRLSFRERGLSKANKKRIYMLLIIFVVAFVFFQIILNHQSRGRVTEMDAPQLPVVTMEALGMQMNELHGYVTEMDAAYMRDAVIPLGSDRKLPISIHTDGYDIDQVSYEIRSMDTERKIAETEVKDYTQADGVISKDLQIENLVEPGEEYLFILTLQSGSQEIYYYTRIMIPQDCYEQQCLDFAMNFHNTSMSSDYTSLSSYVETSADVDTDTLGEVTIHSSINQIGWNGFNGQQVANPVVEMKDINNTYTAIVLYYQMQRENADGGTEYYNVEEYFKVRYSAERMYLLDYTRNMEEVLDEDNISVSNNVLQLGVTSGELQYLSNETGTVVSFVQAGQLYEYDQNKQELTKVFGFMGEDVNDSRAYYKEHNILVLNIDESGTMDFVVYGYMNAGAHEGECGIDLYHYDSTTKEATEQTFISTTKSYQILNANFSSLLYETANGDFYIMVGGTLIKVNLDTLETEEILSGLTEEQYAVSKSGRYISWIDEGKMADTIHIMDLEDESQDSIEAPEGQQICPLAYMEDDFVYGAAYTSDITTDAAGSYVYPMYRVVITDITSSDHEILKDYQKSGYYVIGVTQSDFTLYLQEVQRSGTDYVDAGEDTIKNSSGAKNKAVEVAGIADKGKGKITQITMAELAEGYSIRKYAYEVSGLITADAKKTITVSAKEMEDKYFVYVGSRVTLATEDLTEAIVQADSEMGIVVDNKQQYIWKRGKKTYQNAFTGINVGSLDGSANTSAQCISAMLVREGENVEVHSLLSQGGTPLSILESTLKDATVLDLTGCNLTQVLYYVGQGNPVYAVTGDNQAVLIIGYDAANAIIYNPATGGISKIGLEDGTNMFNQAGNVFISYIK